MSRLFLSVFLPCQAIFQFALDRNKRVFFPGGGGNTAARSPGEEQLLNRWAEFCPQPNMMSIGKRCNYRLSLNELACLCQPEKADPL